jgi:hypothetical protein
MATRWIETFGGPFIALPFEQRAAWRGAPDDDDDEDDNDDSDYGRACRAVRYPRFFGLVEHDAFTALALNREPLAVASSATGVVLVQWDSGANRRGVDRLLRETDLDALTWKATKLSLAIPGGKLAIFDAALHGRIPPAKQHVVDLARGTYAIGTTVWKPDAGTTLLLRRRSKPPKTSRSRAGS